MTFWWRAIQPKKGEIQGGPSGGPQFFALATLGIRTQVEKCVAWLAVWQYCGRLEVVGKYPTGKGKTMTTQDGTYYINQGELVLVDYLTLGYWVAESDYDAPEDYKDLVIFAQQVMEDHDVTRVGIWTDDEGQVKVDATHWVQDLLQAVAMGRFWRQTAIYDIKRKQTIYIKD
jgi:hypothetical protein